MLERAAAHAWLYRAERVIRILNEHNPGVALTGWGYLVKKYVDRHPPLGRVMALDCMRMGYAVQLTGGVNYNAGLNDTVAEFLSLAEYDAAVRHDVTILVVRLWARRHPAARAEVAACD